MDFGRHQPTHTDNANSFHSYSFHSYNFLSYSQVAAYIDLNMDQALKHYMLTKYCFLFVLCVCACLLVL